MKKLFALLLLCPLMFLASCSDSDKEKGEIIGEWRLVEQPFKLDARGEPREIDRLIMYLEAEAREDLGAMMSFSKKGKVTLIDNEGDSGKAKFSTSGNILTLTGNGYSVRMPFSIVGDIMKMEASMTIDDKAEYEKMFEVEVLSLIVTQVYKRVK